MWGSGRLSQRSGHSHGDRQHAFAFVNTSVMLSEPHLPRLPEGRMEVDTVGSRDVPAVSSGLGNFCRVAAEPRRKTT